MEITVNGQKKSFAKEMSVAELLRTLEMEPNIVNVQLNEEVLEKEVYDVVSLKNGDEVEILMYMGGGERG